MIRQNTKDWNLILKTVLFLTAIIAFLAINNMEKAQQENQALLESVAVLEATFEAEREENLQQLEELQREIYLQQEVHEQLKLEILDVEKEKNHLNSQAHEKKTAIARITDLDSLRDEISRHYRP